MRVTFGLEGRDLAESFLKLISKESWYLGAGTVGPEIDTRNPTLHLLIVLDGIPQIRIVDIGKFAPDKVIPTTHELRHQLLTRLKEEEKLKHDAEHQGGKSDPNCGCCIERGKRA